MALSPIFSCDWWRSNLKQYYKREVSIQAKPGAVGDSSAVRLKGLEGAW